jgi:hypothetical protein
MIEDNLQASISRGARAEALIKNELLQEAFKKLEDDYVAAWKTWPAADAAGRERLWQAVNVLTRIISPGCLPTASWRSGN